VGSSEADQVISQQTQNANVPEWSHEVIFGEPNKNVIHKFPTPHEALRQKWARRRVFRLEVNKARLNMLDTRSFNSWQSFKL